MTIIWQTSDNQSQFKSLRDACVSAPSFQASRPLIGLKTGLENVNVRKTSCQRSMEYWIKQVNQGNQTSLSG